MANHPINILVTFDQNYVRPFQTMLTSLVSNNPSEQFTVWLLHSAIPLDELETLDEFCQNQSVTFKPISVDHNIFENARISKRYPKEIYYRLLAPKLLPESVERILYLDPDTLVINPIRMLWEMDLKDNCFSASSHTGLTNIVGGINRIRLQTKHDYYNTGIILMDLNKARAIVEADEIFQTVSRHETELILPDQDVFNYLYGDYTLSIDETIWNYDTRYYANYLLRSGGKADLNWLMKNTAILHYCGKNKPWSSSRPLLTILQFSINIISKFPQEYCKEYPMYHYLNCHFKSIMTKIKSIISFWIKNSSSPTKSV
ncbi:glycosyltransferase family 8 protein [Amphibacillus sp. Q70]|uniref:glycosyltransferase family 8 protein n=1 Tax=Amphibacillus sp. Q70 TaxID=3453416 RepID=UPI003F82E149